MTMEVTSQRPASSRVDLVAAELAAADFLAALGVDLDRDGLRRDAGPDGPRLRRTVRRRSRSR